MTAERPPEEEAHRVDTAGGASWEEVFAQVQPDALRPSEPDWALIFERLERIEQHQFDISSALWAQLHRRLDRIEQNQAELERMALELAGALDVEHRGREGHGVALGSAIDALATPARPTGASSRLRPTPVPQTLQSAAGAGAAPPTDPGVPAAATGSAPPPADAGGERLLPPSWVPTAGPGTGPPWLATPLPEVFSVTPPVVGRRRWFFGRRRDYVVTAEPDWSWPVPAEPGGPPGAPPPPPGFVWSAPAPESTAARPSPESPTERPPAQPPSRTARPGPAHGPGSHGGGGAGAVARARTSATESESGRGRGQDR